MLDVNPLLFTIRENKTVRYYMGHISCSLNYPFTFKLLLHPVLRASNDSLSHNLFIAFLGMSTYIVSLEV